MKWVKLRVGHAVLDAKLLEGAWEKAVGAVLFGIDCPLIFLVRGRPFFWRFIGPPLKVAFVKNNRVIEVVALKGFSPVRPSSPISFAVEFPLNYPVKRGDSVAFFSG